MFRRILGSTVAVTLIATTGISIAAFEKPRATCARMLPDGTGDVAYTFTTGVNDPRGGSIDALDIEAATMRDTPTHLQVFIKVKSLATSFAPWEMAYVYVVKFRNSDRTLFEFGAMIENGTFSNTGQTIGDPNGRNVRANRSSQFPEAKYSLNGSPTQLQLSGEAWEKDDATGWVMVSVPRSEVQKGFVATTLGPGTKLTEMVAETYAIIPGSGDAGTFRKADTTTVTETAKTSYTVGDDYCFGPPRASISIGASTYRAQFSDAVNVSATLISDAGQPLAGKTVTFSVPGDTPKSDTTNASGVATVAYTTTRPAGTYTLTAAFPGDATDGKASVTTKLIVSTEITRLSPISSTRTSSTGRSVATTLTDDDGKGVAGQKVDWYVNGKKVATATTDGAGKAAYKSAKAGQTVQAKFAGLSGKYRAATGAPLRV